jgi:hypothetical protein
MINDPYTLIVALDGNGKAKGHIYIDDGQSFKVICKAYRQEVRIGVGADIFDPN